MKWIIRIVIGLVVLIGVVVGSSYWWLDGAARKTIEVAGSDAMGVTVKLDSIRIGVLGGTAKLDQFRIANPPGYVKPYFFDLSAGSTEIDLGTVMEDVIEIPSVELQGLTMYIEPDGDGKYNYERILENVEKYSESDAPKDESEKHVKIKRIVLRDIKVYYKTKVFVQTPTHVKELVLTDVGSDGSGLNIGELISVIMAGTLKGVASELPGAIGDGIKSGVGKLGDLGSVAVKGVADTAVKGVTEGFKKILGGDDD